MDMKSGRRGEHILVGVALAALATGMVGCGDKADKEDPAAKAEPEARATTPSPAETAPTTTDALARTAIDERTAPAVVTSKSAAAVDLRYEVLSKPEVARPFEVELVFRPRVAADVLEVEVTGVTGLVLEQGASMRFENVEAGGSYTGNVHIRADRVGLYYVSVMARLGSAVQTDKRTFSVPVAVGAVAAQQKTVLPKDATGMPVEPMPATEPSQGDP